MMKNTWMNKYAFNWIHWSIYWALRSIHLVFPLVGCWLGNFIAIHIINRPVYINISILMYKHDKLSCLSNIVWCIFEPDTHTQTHAHDEHFKLNGFYYSKKKKMWPKSIMCPKLILRAEWIDKHSLFFCNGHFSIFWFNMIHETLNTFIKFLCNISYKTNSLNDCWIPMNKPIFSRNLFSFQIYSRNTTDQICQA